MTQAVQTLSEEPIPLGQTEQSALSKDPAPTVTPGLLRRALHPDLLRSLGLGLLSLAAGVLFWHWASATNLNVFVNFENVPGPGKVFASFLGHLETEIFYTHIRVSMQRILISYSIAAALGIGLGLIMGRSRIVRAFVMPYIEVIRPIPAVAWIPLAILMWPTEEASIIYITFLGALFPIVLNTLHGVEQTPEVLVRAAQSLGASRLAIFAHVVLPAAMPSISAGLAIGMGVSWFSLLAGEIISGQYGIGYFTWNAYSLINYQDIVVGMLVIGFLGTASTAAIKLLTKPLLKWQKRTR
ncbi:ABC transporter permease [Puniceibacterium sediminis]|uniref:NitT/TauT family transport system permease protein n=1 Tax=Puniceibacterium sediminis TaxID=1608407 RepID=A0A238ZIW5_9RHOB|nr:ABC transporter permease [Puniceibacterium sediminis]SNR82938.1 NitT/TauT family transport system permease protein [Puniceibacterium sediminis]